MSYLRWVLLFIILGIILSGCSFGRCFEVYPKVPNLSGVEVYPKVPDLSGVEVYPKVPDLSGVEVYPKFPECPER